MAIFNLSLERNIDSLVDFPVVGEINSLKKEMNHLFEVFTPTINSEVKGRTFTPAVEISEGNDAIDLKVEIPGLEPQDLDIQVTAEEVKIRGQRRQETTKEEPGRTRSEFGYGAFQRVIGSAMKSSLHPQLVLFPCHAEAIFHWPMFLHCIIPTS